MALVEPGERFEKIHAKGVIIDGETTIVGSLNWNRNSLENNREVVLAVHGEEPAAYYGAVFEADWEGSSWSLPIGLSFGVVLALIVAAVIGRRYITFGDRQSHAAVGADEDFVDPGGYSSATDPDEEQASATGDSEPSVSDGDEGTQRSRDRRQ